jgi:hypothetical protein
MSANTSMKEEYKYALYIKAFNFFVQSKFVSRISYDPSREDFPKFIKDVKPF